MRCDDPGSGMRCSLVTGERPRNQRPWCGSAALTSRYERIHAEQQRLLRAGAIRDADVDAWRARRDACESASCLESLYHEWWRWRDAGRFRSGLPSVPPSARSSVSPSASSSAALPVPPSAQPAASVAARVPPKPAPVPAVAERASPAPAEAGAPDVLDASGTSSDASPGGTAVAPAASPLDSGVPVSPALLGGVAAFGMGAVYAWQRRRGRGAAPGHGRRRAISAVMAIFYGLLIVNALLLPFTLGWS
ncbi:GntR family transcriptional regulator [Cupriavidus sp. WS]|uniref:GntR family transcriptional regulator n=1 Tax=Cupriavidus sp. WS TaxID=1312922 RepID=UPI0012DF203B|nr:GntR family transcriptional regulator [Cupriavidus sp. WS]